MSTCPYCKATLSDADLRSGRCSKCGRVLVPEGAAHPEPPANGPATGNSEPGPPPLEKGKHTADERRLGETIDPGATPPEQDKGTADERRLAETIDGDATPPPDKTEGTADQRRLAETVDGEAMPATPPPDKTKQTAEERRLAETINGFYKAEVIWRQRSWPSVSAVELVSTADLWCQFDCHGLNSAASESISQPTLRRVFRYMRPRIASNAKRFAQAEKASWAGIDPPSSSQLPINC